ncbi:hypothetical protein Tco_1274318 [Tanacetum coccineum]
MTGPEPSTPLNEGTSNQNNTTTQSIIEGHVSALKELLNEQSNHDLINPMLLNFSDDIQDTDDEIIEINKKKEKGKATVTDEDLIKPFKEALKFPFTRRIIEFSSPGHMMPTNVKIYDGTGDPKDHISRFTRIENQGEWPMPVWCRIFQQTLDGKARAWFDKLPSSSIDNYGDLQGKFLNRIDADLILYELAQVPRIVKGFFSDSIPKTVDEMLKRVDDYVRLEATFVKPIFLKTISQTDLSTARAPCTIHSTTSPSPRLPPSQRVIQRQHSCVNLGFISKNPQRNPYHGTPIEFAATTTASGSTQQRKPEQVL